MKIGAQIYSIRDFCKTKEDLSESLKKIAEIGYKYVQISGTCEYDPLWMKGELDKNGLFCVLTHVTPSKLKDNIESVIKNHNVLNCNYIGLGYNEFSKGNLADQFNNFVDTYTSIAGAIKDGNKYFMYHNHDGELLKYNGKTILENIAETFSSDKLGFILDTFWIQMGGGDPAEWIKKLSGRVPCIHLKDCLPGKEMAPIGEGNINFDRVFEQAEAAGTKYMLVEQDDCNGEDPFVCLQRSYNNLKSFGF